MSRSLRAWIAGVAVVVTTMGVTAAAAQALPTGFWGVVPQNPLSTEQFQRLSRGGVESIRLPVGWSEIQPTRNGPYNWSGVDGQIEKAAKSGIAVLPFVSGAPKWAVPSVPVPGSGGSVKTAVHLPVAGAARTGWVSFLTAAVARYGPAGSFWAEHPDVPRRPLRTWQIWNEANFKYFVAKPNPAEYGQLVKISYAALKSADPGAKLILGGLFAAPREAQINYKPPRAYFATDFLNQMYAKTPGIKSKFSGIALHPYTGKYQELTPEIEKVRKVLKKNHDAGKGLWITELGWSSGPPASDGTNSFAKGPAGQAAQLKGALGLLKARAAKWKVKSVYWFAVDDLAGACNFCDGAGLFGPNSTPKKSWYAYVRFTGGTP